jgi:hypothetical protein
MALQRFSFMRRKPSHWRKFRGCFGEKGCAALMKISPNGACLRTARGAPGAMGSAQACSGTVPSTPKGRAEFRAGVPGCPTGGHHTR